VFDPEELPDLRARIRAQTQADAATLAQIRADVAGLSGTVRTIQPRSTTSVSLVASDGGNNKVEFNPFYLQLVRVVDSYGDQLFLDVVSPSTDTTELATRHLSEDHVRSPLGRLMADLNVSTLGELSPMLPARPRSPSWTLVYRDLCEWATLYDLVCYQRFTTDTLIVRDGLLRSKIFRDDLFIQMYRRMVDAIERIYRDRRREVFLVGIAKHSQVLRQYALAMAVANTFPPGQPCYVPVPQPLQQKVYVWDEYIRAPDDTEPGEAPKFNIGEMYFVRFGSRSGDPVWTADLLACQRDKAQKVFGCLLSDAIPGFPVPFYPMCLQQADHHAQIVDFDLDILQDTLIDAVRLQIESDRQATFDALLLATDVAQRRYQ
jgi:hypothetical protein